MQVDLAVKAEFPKTGSSPNELLRDDGELVLARVARGREKATVLRVAPSSSDVAAIARRRLDHEFDLRERLSPDWSIVPFELRTGPGGIAMLCGDPGGVTLDRLLDRPFSLRRFLHVAVGLSTALQASHAADLIHRDLRPSNIFLGRDGKIRLTGFGKASRLVRERRVFHTLDHGPASWPYLAPEQTGRLSRSIDHRSDLYSVGVILYELLVGALPFAATDAREWAHCHVARVPPPPSARVNRVPPMIEAIVLKLLAKDAEDRYQTAAGLLYDLQLCLRSLNLGEEQPLVSLGERDTPTRIIIPEKLYGREAVVERLVETLDHVASHDSFELLLISGEAGSGKTALVGELRRAVFARNGFFTAGKFDPFKRNVPYGTLGEAFGSLFRQLLSLDEERLDPWRDALQQALGESGQMMVRLFPELALIVGAHPELPPLSPQEAKNRFHLVFMRCLGVFASASHPLVLFLDDLQWLDPATCELLELIAGEEQVPNLLLVATYSGTEVGEEHPLRMCLDRISERRGGLHELALEPLKRKDAAQLVADTLRLAEPSARDLGEIIWQKTRGNPFFIVQFLTNLADDGLLRFDFEQGRWTFDVERIGRQAITSNVAVLLAERLKRYKGATLSAAKQLACLGLHATDEILADLLDLPGAALDTALRTLVRDGLIQRIDGRYLFAHDGVREAAYGLIPEAERPAMHLAIGRALRGVPDIAGHDVAVFDVVDQLNRARDLIVATDERIELAGLNLAAGLRAKSAAAYAPAQQYLALGLDLLKGASNPENEALVFELEFNLSDCEFMLGLLDAAEERLERLSLDSVTNAQLGQVVGRQLILFTYVGRYDHAIDLSLAFLARMGVELPKTPSEKDFATEFEDFLALVGERSLDSIIDVPPMTDALQLQTMSALADLFSPAGTVNTDLHHLAALRMVNLSLQHGMSHETAHGLACLAGQVFGWRVGTFAQAKVLGDAAMRLVEEKGFDRFAMRVYAVISGTIGPWSRPLADCYRIAVLATEIGRERGSVTYSGYAWGVALTALLDAGRPLPEVERQAEASLATLARTRFPLVVDFLTAQLHLARALRGQTDELDSLNSPSFDELAYRERVTGAPHLWHALVRYRIRKLQLHCISGNLDLAMAMLAALEEEADTLRVFELAEYHFYSALIRSAALTSEPRPTQAGSFDQLLESHRRLRDWATLCPENFECRALLVEAEIAQLEQRWLDAEQFYEEAIAAADRDGFQQVEALAQERASHFYARRGLRTSSEAYLAKARASYERWGALAKVQQLDRSQPALLGGDGRSIASVDQRDLEAAIGIYQTISREIVLDRLIDQLMTIAIEHAAASRGLLLLSQEGRLRIVAEAGSDQNGIHVTSRRPAHFSGELPESLLNYVGRTHELIIIEDAHQPNAHSGDPYIVRARPRSVLCLPLVKQSRLVGVLYLENQLASNVFTTDRVAVLQFVASQAAISIENAELFRDIQRTQDEARRASEEVRRSFDMIPALAWSASPDGLLEFSNKQWHDYTGLGERDAQGTTWFNGFHPDDLDRVTEKWNQLQAYRASGEFEARMRRFDGQYRRFLVRLTPMLDCEGEVLRWHGTNTDIDELKQIEEAQEALARASRVTAMGALTVSIAHEVNQPLMAIVTNAATCLRWLSAPEPQVEEARLAAERIIRDGHRAGDVIASIRSIARNAAPKASAVDLAGMTDEILQLTRSEFERHAISVETDFAEAAIVYGDRTQVQQVILNLVVNGIEAIQASRKTDRVLTVGARLGDGPFVELWVADSGIGLAPAMRDKVFDAFFTTKDEGIGIGLSICRTIVENHGGKLWITERDPAGTVFHVLLPRWQPGEAS